MVRMFLVTANVGSVFDNLELGLPVWLNEFSSVVSSKNPEFLAIHFQETGGKSCNDASDSIKEFFRRLVESMEQLNFCVADGFVDSTSNVEEQFTALSSIYFVHESLELPVHIWDFQDAEFHEVKRSVTPSSAALHPNIHMGPRLNQTNRKQKEKFPQNFYPNCKWSRKGFLRTRWRFGKTTVDLVNIHLFHDSSNVVAASVFPSPFAQHREKSLKYTLDRILSDGLGERSLFIFGDFNFRINACGVMDVLKKDYGEPVSKLCEENSLVLSTKKFHCPDQELRFIKKFEWLKQYDLESKQYDLQEYDLNFHPTYPFSEDLNEPDKYMRTRLPAWCDRVLFTPSTRDIFAKDSPNNYDLIGSTVCMGDHKPVGLLVKIRANDCRNCTSNEGVSGPTSANDTSNKKIDDKGNSRMARFIGEVSKPTFTSSLFATTTIMVSGPVPTKAIITSAASPAAIVDDENNVPISSSTSHSLQNGSNRNLVKLDNNGGGLKKPISFNAHENMNISPSLSVKDRVCNDYTVDVDTIESEFASPTSTAKSNCFFGALFRCRGKLRFSQENGTGCRNNGDGAKSKALSGFKALSKCKRGGGGGSISCSGSLLEPIAGAGYDFPCSSLPSSVVSSQRPSVTGSISTGVQMECYHLEECNAKLCKNQKANRSYYFGNFFTAPSKSSCIIPNGKVKQSKDCYGNKCSRCCCCNGKSISASSEEPAVPPTISTDCRCQNRLMLNLATVLTNSCTSINNSRNNISNGDLPLGSSNLSLIAINNSTDLDKQTFVDNNGKIIDDCCNEKQGKIPVCWATTTTYNNGNNKLSSNCANCNSVNVKNKNFHNINCSSQHRYPQGATGEKNSSKAQNNGLPFTFRNRSASQDSAPLKAKCKCHIKESMNRTTGGCVNCSKCTIL